MARAYEVPLTVMRAVAFAIGGLVIARTTYSAIVDRRREYRTVKAIGARGRHVVGLAVRQTMLVSAIGLVFGGVLFVAGRAYINAVRPQFLILATPGNVGRAVAAAVLMGLVAAILPARRLAKLEPATAYRGGWHGLRSRLARPQEPLPGSPAARGRGPGHVARGRRLWGSRQHGDRPGVRHGRPAGPAFHLQADAQEWWFCSDGCRVDFAVHPDRYPEGRSRLR